MKKNEGGEIETGINHIYVMIRLETKTAHFVPRVQLGRHEKRASCVKKKKQKKNFKTVLRYITQTHSGHVNEMWCHGDISSHGESRYKWLLRCYCYFSKQFDA